MEVVVGWESFVVVVFFSVKIRISLRGEAQSNQLPANCLPEARKVLYQKMLLLATPLPLPHPSRKLWLSRAEFGHGKLWAIGGHGKIISGHEKSGMDNFHNVVTKCVYG